MARRCSASSGRGKACPRQLAEQYTLPFRIPARLAPHQAQKRGSEGFRDGTGLYGKAQLSTGVWLADRPLDESACESVAFRNLRGGAAVDTIMGGRVNDAGHRGPDGVAASPR